MLISRKIVVLELTIKNKIMLATINRAFQTHTNNPVSQAKYSDILGIKFTNIQVLSR